MQHGRVCGNDQFLYGVGVILTQLCKHVARFIKDQALQMRTVAIGISVDSAEHVRAVYALRIECRGLCKDLSALQIDKTRGKCGGANVQNRAKTVTLSAYGNRRKEGKPISRRLLKGNGQGTAHARVAGENHSVSVGLCSFYRTRYKVNLAFAAGPFATARGGKVKSVLAKHV